ncbi:MAG: hypothetical protein WAO08_33665, partial [Hyphomicrobiaceae bacterium]
MSEIDHWRKLLHDGVDRIVDGPGEGPPDEWVVQVLADLGNIIRAARPALDYEVGRVMEGVVDRPLGDFPNNNTSWHGAGIDVGVRQAEAWKIAGRTAPESATPSELQQRALAAILMPIANVACNSLFFALADALDALALGEVRPILATSTRGLHGIGKGKTAWQLRLSALKWAEFHVAAGKIETKAEAFERVANEFGRASDTIKDWRSSATNALGGAKVDEALAQSQRIGELNREIRARAARVEVDAPDRRLLDLSERAYSEEALKQLAIKFKALPRKKHEGGNGRSHIP